MALETFPSCIGAYFLDSTGVSGSTLVDQTTYGNNMALTGSIIYATRGGYEGMDFNNSFFFEGANVLLPGGSAVVVAMSNADGADGSLFLFNTLSRKASAGNYDGVPNEAVTADWFAGTYGRKGVFFNTNQPTIFGYDGNFVSGTSFGADTKNLFTAAVSIDPARVEGTTKTQVVQTAAYGAGASATILGSHMRIGSLKASGTLPGGHYLWGKRVYFFNENVLNNANFTAARAAEIVQWGL